MSRPQRPENRTPLSLACARRDSRAARVIGRYALMSLHQELATYPKPGLVSPVDSGSHKDMDASMFFRSLFSLRQYFPAIASAGMNGDPFAALKQLGIAAEKRMLKATAGVNTHRGAIFNLGLLAAAAGHLLASDRPLRGGAIGATVHACWGAEIEDHGRALPGVSHGRRVASRYGAGGALQEASLGFPHVFEVGLPALRRSLSLGADSNGAAVHCLFSLMERLPDTNLLHRGGDEGLEFVRRSARSFLAEGGVHQPAWRSRAVDLHRQFVRRNLSPGGSADLLAATLFVHRLQS